MKNILEDDIINDILNLSIYNKKINLDLVTIQVLEYCSYLYLTGHFLDLFKLNMGLNIYTIPIFIIHFSYDTYKQIKNNKKKFILKRKSILQKMKRIKLICSPDDFLDAIIIKDEYTRNKFHSLYIIINSHKNIEIIKEERSLNNNKKTNIVYKLEDFKKYGSIDNDTLDELDIKEELQKKKEKKKFYFRLLKKAIMFTKVSSLFVLLSLISSIKNHTNTLTNQLENEKIIEYFDDEENLNNNELDKIIEDITKTIKNRYNIDILGNQELETYKDKKDYLLLNAIDQNINATNYEKKVLYEFYDIFNDNPYLDYKKVYAKLKKLDFVRNYNPFTKGKKNPSANTIVVAFYDGEKIYYCTNPTDEVIKHEVTHAIFDTETIPLSYVEGYAEIIQNEYNDNEYFCYNAYNKNVALTKITIELIGKDKFLEAITTDNIEIIRNALIDVYISNNVNVSYQEAFNFVNNFLISIHYSLPDFSSTNLIAENLLEFYYNADTGVYDYDKKMRLYKYTNIIIMGLNDNDIYYYLNEDKIKTLKKN